MLGHVLHEFSTIFAQTLFASHVLVMLIEGSPQLLPLRLRVFSADAGFAAASGQAFIF